jgi:hypothetical protein
MFIHLNVFPETKPILFLFSFFLFWLVGWMVDTNAMKLYFKNVDLKRQCVLKLHQGKYKYCGKDGVFCVGGLLEYHILQTSIF